MDTRHQCAALITAGRLVEAGWVMSRDSFVADPSADESAFRAAFFAGAEFLFHQVVEAARNNEDGTRLVQFGREFQEFEKVQKLMSTPAAGRA